MAARASPSVRGPPPHIHYLVPMARRGSEGHVNRHRHCGRQRKVALGHRGGDEEPLSNNHGSNGREEELVGRECEEKGLHGHGQVVEDVAWGRE